MMIFGIREHRECDEQLVPSVRQVVAFAGLGDEVEEEDSEAVLVEGHDDPEVDQKTLEVDLPGLRVLLDDQGSWVVR